MPGKVSMVIPCYNKSETIGEMLDSVLLQDWPNIELILINDGSTDGTREIIVAYESKFRERGLEVNLIDQENAGVCAAAKKGLEHVTGDYVCMVDADDELDPKYIKTMASWLDTNCEYDITACGGINYTGCGNKKKYEAFTPREIVIDEPTIVERWMMGDMRVTVWIYMIRVEYLRKCRIVDTYYTQTRGSHEPGYIIPLLSHGGKLKYFPLPLYHFNITGEGHSRSNYYAKMEYFHREYNKLSHIAIERLPDSIANTKRKKKLIGVSKISTCLRMYKSATTLDDGHEHVDQAFAQLLHSINRAFHFKEPITPEQALGREESLIRLIYKVLINYHKKPGGRIIGYGVLGKRAALRLPILRGTDLEPTVFWDIKGDGITIEKPDFGSLSDRDTLLVFPAGNIIDEILDDIAETGCTIYGAETIDYFLKDFYQFPQFLASTQES